MKRNERPATNLEHMEHLFVLAPAIATRPDVRSTLSDLCICSGIIDYREVLPNINHRDEGMIIQFVEAYTALDIEADHKNDDVEQKRILKLLNDKLLEIRDRTP